MRQEAINVLSSADYLNATGSKIDSGQLINASFHTYFGDATAAGTVKIQASNDPVPNGAMRFQFTPTNWVDIPNASATITAGTSSLISLANIAYNWIRVVWTSTGTGAQTITTRADVAGNLNSKYFLLNSANAGTGYYVWLTNGSGVDPLIPGRTAVPVTFTNADTANTIGDLVAAEIDGLANFIAPNPAANVITVTNSASGPFVPMVDGNTGFTFAITAGGTTTINTNMDAVGI